MFVGVGASRVRDMFEQGKKIHRALYLLMKLMQLDEVEELDLVEVMTKESKHLISF